MLETPKALSTSMVTILKMRQWAISRDRSKKTSPQRLPMSDRDHLNVKGIVYSLLSISKERVLRKRGIAGSMVFAVFDHDSLVSALQRVWGDIAPAAMFTAAGNSAVAKSEAFEDALNMLKWNVKTGANIQNGYGYSGKSTISANTAVGSNGAPVLGEDGYFVESWQQGETINVPTGFEPIRGGSVLYADTVPPFDVTLTFANEYGQTAFQKIYDVDILNESSGVSVDSIVMERQVTYIARRISPLVRGIYTRDSEGTLKGVQPTSV